MLAIGDPFQLPPVEGVPFFTEDKSDFYLTEVHRTALTNPIIEASEGLRNGKFPAYIDEDQLKVIGLDEASADIFIRADQIVVPTNDWRRHINKLIRKIRGFESPTLSRTEPMMDGVSHAEYRR